MSYIEEVCDAVVEHDIDNLITLLDDSPAAINAFNIIGWTPLHHAVDLEFSEVVELLVNSFSADVNLRTRDSNQWTALHIASFWGHSELVVLLLQCENLNINALDSQRRTALHLAANCGHSDIVRLLLSEGAKSNLLSAASEKPYDLAHKSGHASCAKMLKISGNFQTPHIKFLCFYRRNPLHQRTN